MNTKLKRAVAIIALILMCVFTVSLILYLFDATMLNGAIGSLALWTGCFGLLLCLVLWLSHAFPAQQRKDEEREKLYTEADRLQEKDRSDNEAANDDQSDGDGANEAENAEIIDNADHKDNVDNAEKTDNAENADNIDDKKP